MRFTRFNLIRLRSCLKRIKGVKMTEGLLGSAVEATASLAVGIMNHDENKRMRKVAQGQLDLAKEQYQWEKDKYNTTLENQTQAYNTLGDSFGKALEKESNTPTLSQSSDSMASFAQSKEQSPTQDSSSTAPQMQKEQPLPTERM